MTIKISELGNLTSFTDTTLFPVVDTSNTYITVKSTGSTRKDYIFTGVGNLTVSGNITANGYVNATYLTGDGSALTGITSYSNVYVATYLPTHSSNVGGTLSTAAQPYVTSLGELTTLTVDGDISTTNGNIGAPNYLFGNIIVMNQVLDYYNLVNVANTYTYSLSDTITNNILLIFADNPTATIDMPTAPQDGQVARISANANVVLSLGTGNVSPDFSGANVLVAPLSYIYNAQWQIWFRI